MTKKKYLVALPCFRGTRGFNCPTILVSSSKGIQDVISIVNHLRPHAYIGDIKKVNY